MAADIATALLVLFGFHHINGWGRSWAVNLGLLRRNTLGEWIPTSVAFPAVAVQGLALLFLGGPLAFAGAAGLVFAGVGLYDDLCGCRDRRQLAVKGWRGHLGALRRGRLTSGAVKLLVGGTAALILTAAFVPGSAASVVRDALVVALSANAINALDVRRGRAGKALLLGLVALTGRGDGGMLMIFPVLVFLPKDLCGEVMMGDCGANGWGAMLGAAAVASGGAVLRWGLLGALLALQVAAETVTLSQIIRSCRLLTILDEAGT
ncbi:MAG: hypothetical protein R6U70_10910 [Bacillota bacterium]